MSTGVIVRFNEEILLSSSLNGTVTSYNISTGQAVSKFKIHNDSIYSIQTFSNSTVISSGSGYEVFIFNPLNGTILNQLYSRMQEAYVILVIDKNSFAVGYSDGDVIIYNNYNGNLTLSKSLSNQSASVVAMALANNSRWFL